jgi:benzoate/toluate 1,2-dioxygenase subunit beta
VKVVDIEQTTSPALAEAEAFLFHEAALLDDGRLDEWQRLFDEDGEYWLPATAGQESPLDQVSHVYEDRLLREIRIARFQDPTAASVQPPPRSSHLVSNVRLIGERDPGSSCWIVKSRFVVAQFHRDRQTLFAGEYVHHLRYTDNRLWIRQKRVNLVNCEGVMGDIVVYL